jgi:hypothetical protein
VKTGIHIEGGKPTGPVVQVRVTLEKIALRATELGRETVACEAVRALQRIAGVEQHVSINGAVISG